MLVVGYLHPVLTEEHPPGEPVAGLLVTAAAGWCLAVAGPWSLAVGLAGGPVPALPLAVALSSLALVAGPLACSLDGWLHRALVTVTAGTVGIAALSLPEAGFFALPVAVLLIWALIVGWTGVRFPVPVGLPVGPRGKRV